VAGGLEELGGGVEGTRRAEEEGGEREVGRRGGGAEVGVGERQFE
jgi:hypothetical protein